jgi:hypothetical protein
MSCRFIAAGFILIPYSIHIAGLIAYWEVAS